MTLNGRAVLGERWSPVRPTGRRIAEGELTVAYSDSKAVDSPLRTTLREVLWRTSNRWRTQGTNLGTTLPRRWTWWSME